MSEHTAAATPHDQTRRPPRIPIRFYVRRGTYETALYVVIDRDYENIVVEMFESRYDAQQWVKEHQPRV